MIIVLVAGEASGDQLGAALIRAIRLKHPEAQFAGIGGPLMSAEGFECWWDTSELSLMGLSEVISHLPRLLKLRKQLIQRVMEHKPDVFVGIDAPDFNLGVEKRLKKRSVPVIHYVSPTIWAWRSGRVKTITKSTERVLCLFPFEPECYVQYPVAADYTGHPMADEIPMLVDAEQARNALAVGSESTCIGLLPGSRMSEVEKLSVAMLDAANILNQQKPGLYFLIPATTEKIAVFLKTLLNDYPTINCRVFSGQGKEVMAASDVVICASGTATLEVMLVNRPMVVCYRVSNMTYRLLKWFKLIKTRFFSLPNILAGELLVPELQQDEVTGERIAVEAAQWLDQPERIIALKHRFDELHKVLKTDAATTAAKAVLQHIAHRRG